MTGLIFALFIQLEVIHAVCQMRSSVCIHVDKWILCRGVAPGAPIGHEGCQPQTKAAEYKGVRDLVESQGLGGFSLGWWGNFMWSKWIRVELTRGVPSPAWENRGGHWERIMLWARTLVSRAGGRDPWRFCGARGGLVKWPHCFCGTVTPT